MPKKELPFYFTDTDMEKFIDEHLKSYHFTDNIAMLARAINISSHINNTSFADHLKMDIRHLKEKLENAERTLKKGVLKNPKSMFEIDLIFLQKGISVIRFSDNESSNTLKVLKTLLK